MTYETTRGESHFRLILAVITALTFYIATVPGANWPYAAIGGAGAMPLVMGSMAAIGLLVIGIGRLDLDKWSALLMLGAAEFAVASGWVSAVGVPNLPEPLWSFPSLIFGMFAAILTLSAGFVRILQTVNPGEQFNGLDRRTVWETLLPWALVGATFFALKGYPFSALGWMVVIMAIQFFWRPTWTVTRAHTVA